jgi:hypothetical protein
MLKLRAFQVMPLVQTQKRGWPRIHPLHADHTSGIMNEPMGIFYKPALICGGLPQLKQLRECVLAGAQSDFANRKCTYDSHLPG